MTQDKHILIRNIYYMLAYAFRSLSRRDLVNVDAEEFDNIHELFAAILDIGIGQQLKQGLYRDYLYRTEDLATVRGRIDMAGSIRHKVARRQVLSCEYDDLSENNLLNRILKTTALLLIGSEHVREHKDALKKKMMFFSHVDVLSPRSISWSNVRFHRNNQTYRMLIGMCQLVIEGMLLTTESGEHRLASFVDDQAMSRLYEKFVLEYYRCEFPQLNATPSQVPWAFGGGFPVSDEYKRGEDLLPTMKTDITLTDRKTNRVLIIDTKYCGEILQGRYDKKSIASHHIYQIFTYVKNKEAGFKDMPHTVSGMLLYARTTEAVFSDISVNLSGNRIEVRTLDLNCDFSAIRSQLDQIVTDFFGNDGQLALF